MKIIVQDLNFTVEFCSIIQLCVFAIWSRRKQNIHFHEFFNHHVCLSFYDSMIWFVGLIVIYLEPQHDYWIWLNHYFKFVAAGNECVLKSEIQSEYYLGQKTFLRHQERQSFTWHIAVCIYFIMIVHKPIYRIHVIQISRP